ncbi:MAG: glycosyl hydrolase family 25 [Bacteroidaceae bacterium]|nr:glycosyl hydrolase family 25 [Bacteroidaceae bacterium]MDE6159316.1 glycosyl hydrolase family 25 [Bacteroidaceae bacterium]
MSLQQSRREHLKTIAFWPVILLLSCVCVIPAWGDKKKKDIVPTDPVPDAYLPPLPLPTPLRAEELLCMRPVLERDIHYVGNIKGIDVSRYQGNIDWQQVARGRHAGYAYIKASENASLIDPRYYDNVREARRAKIPIGSYHFYSPSASPMVQLMNLKRAMPNLKHQDLVPMIDVEVRGRSNYKTFIENLRQFLLSVEKHYGVKPIIYTGTNFYNKYLAGCFEDYMFMIARYGDEPPCLEGNPKFVIWQYSDCGRIPGINHHVDLSTFVDDYKLKDIMVKKK